MQLHPGAVPLRPVEHTERKAPSVKKVQKASREGIFAISPRRRCGTAPASCLRQPLATVGEGPALQPAVRTALASDDTPILSVDPPTRARYLSGMVQRSPSSRLPFSLLGASRIVPLSAALLLASGCAGAVGEGEEGGEALYDPREVGGEYGALGLSAVPDVRCAAAPSAGPTRSWRHFGSRIVALQSPRHRGFDLVASSTAGAQLLSGEISYGLIDKSLEDERVDLFACIAGSWARLGTTITDDEGIFELALTGGSRLPIGMRDLFVSVQGDRTGTRFLAFVAPPGTALAVSDVDGTLTSTEEAFPLSLAFGGDVGLHAGAPAIFDGLAGRGYQPVYLTARGDIFTADTRAWLAAKGLPRGPLRLAPHLITLPGGDTVGLKADILEALNETGLAVEVGIGNRGSDVSAYQLTGLAGDRVLVKLPEYLDEVAGEIGAGRATGFDHYAALTELVSALPPR
jgi:hypothetical protein